MILHKDRAAFRTLLNTIAEQSGIRADVLEKDYYVTLLLKEFSEKQTFIPAYFKGGTALYKALKSIRRFSEDIDITLSADKYGSASQVKKNLEQVAKKYTSLFYDGVEDNRKGSIAAIYNYESLYDIDLDDALQRYGRVKVEATSFTISEPHEGIEISPVIYDYASAEYKKSLREFYDVVPFTVQTITMERIFVDKLFAAEFYYERRDYFDVAKHLYDITVLYDHVSIAKLLKDAEEMNRLLSYKRREEIVRQGSTLANKRLTDFSYLTQIYSDDEFAQSFRRMQKIYVFKEADVISAEKVYDVVNRLREYFHMFQDESLSAVKKVKTIDFEM